MRWSNPFSQSRMSHQAIGHAMMFAMITGRLNCHTRSRTMSRVRRQDLADADLLRPALRGEGGKPEEAEAADDHRQGRECGKDLRTRVLGLVELANDVLAELGLERTSLVICFHWRSTAASTVEGSPR